MENIKKVFWWSLSVLLLASAIWTIISMKPLIQYGNSLVSARTISVSAEGKVTAIPDIASVSFSVLSEGKSPEDITAANAQKMNASIDFVKKEGIADKDIKTTGYTLSPKYEYDKNRKTTYISGYRLEQTIQLKIRDFTKIGKILGALPGFGVNEVGALSFGIDEQENYLNAARKQAFEKAFAKAKTMAEQNGVKIKRVVTFSESRNYPYPIYRAAALESISAAPQVEPGSQEVTVNVAVTYEIK